MPSGTDTRSIGADLPLLAHLLLCLTDLKFDQLLEDFPGLYKASGCVWEAERTSGAGVQCARARAQLQAILIFRSRYVFLTFSTRIALLVSMPR